MALSEQYLSLNPSCLNQWLVIFLSLFVNTINAQSQTPSPTKFQDEDSAHVEETTTSQPKFQEEESVNIGDSKDDNTILIIILTLLGCLLIIAIIIVGYRCYRKKYGRTGMQRIHDMETDDETDDENLAINTDAI
eukprot:CAMPEP_0201590030 /NCGR_PEP_ID=MMETSP0190_2-20130828/173437_1 /ASSEMBLY_ACC=CAM_ASM_000263 /TAXON_ID=37353 /ORGANISM="Rosalina sp." /LENGTH=134 /DNA_ID=CAMNT_0048045347 /DNA_START=20 /DNA_END=424 /DNA_ORIENTATION=+